MIREDFTCALIRPSHGDMESIQLTATWKFDEALEQHGIIAPSNASMNDMLAMLSADSADPALFSRSCHQLSQERQTPAFIVHDDIIVWTLTQFLDTAPPEQYAALHFCPHHSVNITGPTLVCGADPARFFETGFFRALIRPLQTWEICYLQEVALKHSEHGAAPLVPLKAGRYKTAEETYDAHFLKPHNNDDSEVPSLTDFLKKGRPDASNL